MPRTWTWLVAVSIAVSSVGVAEAKYTIKMENAPPPKELKEPVRKLMSDRAIQLVDDKGGPIAEFWFRKEVPVKATPEQVKNGLTYREMEETTLLGAVRFDQIFTDYRKQKIKPGVYTLRLGFQPMDGDHMGTAPYPDFCLLVPAALDEKPEVMDPKEHRELSNKAPGGSHPGVMMLFPNEKPDSMPQLQDKGNGNLALALKLDAVAGSLKAGIGLALTVAGHTTAE
jgi:hypothetical protein